MYIYIYFSCRKYGVRLVVDFLMEQIKDENQKITKKCEENTGKATKTKQFYVNKKIQNINLKDHNSKEALKMQRKKFIGDIKSSGKPSPKRMENYVCNQSNRKYGKVK